jgi:hypothetical protein
MSSQSNFVSTSTSASCRPGPGSSARWRGASASSSATGWRRALAGGPPPPREVASDAELVRRVASRRGALAYLAWDAFSRLPQDGVRVVRLRDGSRLLGPEDPSYPLRLAPPQAPRPAGRNEPQ